MKKLRVVISIASFIVFIWVLNGCKNVAPPTAPATNNNTPVVYTQTQTATSGAAATFTQTAAFSATASATTTNTTVSTAVFTATDTAQYTQTVSCTFSATQTQTFTGTISSTATQTVTATSTRTATPTVTAVIPVLGHPYGVVYANSGLYVSDWSKNLVMKFGTDETYISTLGSTGTGNGQYSIPYGVGTNSSGNIYVADALNGRIVEFNSSGDFVRNFGSPGAGDGQLNLPNGAAVDSAGNVFVADRNNFRIVEFTSSGDFVRNFGTGVAIDVICADSADNIYAGDYFTNKVFVFSNNGTPMGSFGSTGTGDGQFNSISGITVDDAGYIFVSDASNNNVQEFTPSYVYYAKYTGSYNAPINIDWHNGTVYVANYGGNNILSFTPIAPPTATATATATRTATPVVTVCTKAFGNDDLNYTVAWWGGYLMGSPFVAGISSTVNSISGLSANNDSVIAGIYSDSSGKPGTLLAQTVVTAVAGGRLEIPLISSLAVTQGTTYWLITEGINFGAVFDGGVPGTTLYAPEPWANVSSGLPADISSLSWVTHYSNLSVELAAYNCQ